MPARVPPTPLLPTGRSPAATSLLDQVGVGGMGSVWRAWDLRR